MSWSSGQWTREVRQTRKKKLKGEEEGGEEKLTKRKNLKKSLAEAREGNNPENLSDEKRQKHLLSLPKAREGR